MRIDVKCEKRVRLKCIYLKSQSQYNEKKKFNSDEVSGVKR